MELGNRVLVAGHKGTVRYVGPVQGQQGAWVGIEWDDASRGKHDGATGGVQYFSCASGAAAGSFVRAEKVPAGAGLLDALRARYTNQCAEGAGAQDGEVFLRTASNRKVLVELVGEDKVTARQSQLHQLTSARVVGAGVSSTAAKHDDLAAALPSLTELDLTDNLLHSWDQVAHVLQSLPALRTVNLTANRLQLPSSCPALEAPALTNLHSLVLNDCAVTWPDLATLQASLPDLRELHATSNGISCLATDGVAAHSQPVTGFGSLQVLDLDRNQIASWSEVERLASLPALQRLHLSDNRLNGVAYPTAAPGGGGDQQQQQPFGRLQALFLGNNQIASWPSVDQLDRFPALVELRLSGNPVMEGAKSGGRFEVIGRVGVLTMLNGADIKPRERRDCELRYLQNIGAELAEATAADAADAATGGQPGGASSSGAAAVPEARGPRAAALLGHHPRFAALQERYGAVSLTATAKAAAQGSSLAASMVEVTLVGGAKSSSKKLPPSTTVGALKLLCSRLFRTKPERQLLLLLRGPGEGADQQEDIAGDDSKPLAFFSILPGSTITVAEDDPDARAAQQAADRAAAQQEHEARMAAQLREGELIRAAARG